jgi:hypothetical protein
VLFEKWLATAPRGKTIALICWALAEVAEPADIAVCVQLQQEDLNFVNGWPMALLGDDLPKCPATSPAQVLQPVNARNPYGKVDVLAFMRDRQAQLPVWCETWHLPP